MLRRRPQLVLFDRFHPRARLTGNGGFRNNYFVRAIGVERGTPVGSMGDGFLCLGEIEIECPQDLGVGHICVDDRRPAGGFCRPFWWSFTAPRNKKCNRE